MNKVVNLDGFFNQKESKALSGHAIKRLRKKPSNRQQNYRDYCLRYFGLYEKATNAAVCFCISREMDWDMPGRKSQQRRFIAKFAKIKKRPQRKKKADLKKDENFYSTCQWKELRFIALRLSEGRCTLCGARASDGVQLHVDHIKPRSKYPELELDLDNLQILCEDCNCGKSNYDDTDYRSW